MTYQHYLLHNDIVDWCRWCISASPWLQNWM